MVFCVYKHHTGGTMKTTNDIEYVKFCDGFYETIDIYNEECENCFEKKLFNVCNKDVADVESTILKNPLLINWTVTGKCQNSCLYCYGDDIISCKTIINKMEIDDIINHLRYIRPKVVVISGGEPLLHPLLNYIIDKFTFCEVIIDTNGIALSEKFIKVIKKRFHLRISLDSQLEVVNGYLRKSSIENSTDVIVNNIKKCIEENVVFSIQTVLTDLNYLEITKLGDFLINLGVKMWRILVVTPNSVRFNKYANNHWLDDAISNIHEYALKNKDKIKIRLANYGKYNGKGIILLNPEGKYYVRKINDKRKSLIDEENPRKPSVETILNVLDVNAHMERYFGERL